MAGSQLEPLGGELTRWEAWHKEHPATKIAADPLKPPRGVLPRKLVAAVVKAIPPKIALPGLTTVDNRLSPHDEIAGISIGDETWAYPLSLLRRHNVINHEVGGVSIVVLFDPKVDLVRAFRREIGGHPIKLMLENDVISDLEGSMRWKQNGEPLSGVTDRPLEPVAISRQWWHGWSEFHPRTDIYRIE
jgi:hypothetical protein